MSDSADGGVRRVVRPQRRYRPSRQEQDEAWSRLLSKMDAFYTEASDRLAVRTRPVTLARLLDSGVCIGLLDPDYSNIMANAIFTSDLRPDDREKVMVGAAVEEKLDQLGRRSLEGLVAFLLYFFPYLAKWEAVRYLLLADADLLAAASLIVADRCMARFSLDSPVAAPAFVEASTLAAQIAKHSQPKQLAHVWMLLSSRLHQVLALLLEVQPHAPRQNLDDLKALLEEPVVPYLSISWDLAASRLLHSSNNNITRMPYQHTRSLRMVTLDTIHGFYLKALAMLPGDELHSRLHRSLLRAGHCYGPLDPVSNIILNTIWYETNFPAAESPKLYAIGPNSLARLVSRSFYGHISFLQTRYHDLSEHQIVQYMLAAYGLLSATKEMVVEQLHQDQHGSNDCHRHHCMFCLYDDAVRKMEQQIPCADLKDAYMAAAIAAWHPNPEEQAKFLASWDPKHCPAFYLRNSSQLLNEYASHLTP